LTLGREALRLAITRIFSTVMVEKVAHAFTS
jgi:hypothetical protein